MLDVLHDAEGWAKLWHEEGKGEDAKNAVKRGRATTAGDVVSKTNEEGWIEIVLMLSSQ